MSEKMQNSYLGKYREIIIAVGFFLVFDLAVLVLNFYVSFQISASAVEINLAGRQRMLSQRMTKELLIAVQDKQNEQDMSDSLAAVAKSVVLFDQTLQGFKVGGKVSGGDGKSVYIQAITSAEGQEVLAKTESVWRPLNERITALVNSSNHDYALESAVIYAREHNLELLKLMNQLTTKLEQEANARADSLRMVQTIGIMLALLNFGFILFKFLGRLRENDRKIDAAQCETAEILGTVREGLFLLDKDFCLGSQYSASLATVIGRPIQAGSNFRAILADMIPAEACKSACEYIELLLGDRVKESLVQDLNPLTNMLVTVNHEGVSQQRYLTLHFNRALKDGKVSHLLVTVFDVTMQVELEQELVSARKKAKAEMEVLLDLLKVNPATLRQYLERAEHELLNINEQLRHIEGSRDYRRTISQIFRQIHTLKGDAAMLGLEMFEELAHKFESMLAELRSKGTVMGSDLLAIPLPLDEFLQRISHVRELSQRLSALQTAFPSDDNPVDVIKNMTSLAGRIAADHAKQVRLTTELQLMAQLPSPVRTGLNDIALQLLRNAIVHGLESPEERLVLDKHEVGQVHVSLNRIDDDFEFIMRDDGRGIVPEKIRAELIQQGRYSEVQLQQLNDHQIIMKIFEAGFSTANTPNRDAGRGVGLDVVKHMINQLGASLHITTMEHVYTQFRIRFAVPEEATV